MLVAEFVDDGGAGGVLVAEDAGKPASAMMRRRQVGRKGWTGCRGNSPSRRRPARPRSPNGRTACPCPSMSRRRSPRRLSARRGGARLGGSRPVEASQASPRPRAARFGRSSGPCRKPARSPLPCSAGLRDVAERVGARVAVGGRIFGAADADGIEDDQKGAGHRCGPGRREPATCVTRCDRPAA